MKYRLNRGKWKGSYTVEASIVMAIVILVLAALIFAAFYMHDRAVLQGISCEIASAGRNAATQSERQKAMAALKNGFSSDRLLGSRQVSGQAEAGKKKVSSVWKGNFYFPGFVMKYFAGGHYTIHVSWNSEVVQPADTIRKIRGVRKLVIGGSD